MVEDDAEKEADYRSRLDLYLERKPARATGESEG